MTTERISDQQTRGVQCRVMIVDDDLPVHATVAIVLGHGDVNHMSVLPQKFEEQLAAYQPTVILLDLSMPRLDGIQALEILRTQQYEGRVIVMSGGDRELIETARRVGQSYGLRMAPGIQKPFRAAELLAAVRSDDAAKPVSGPVSEIGRAFALNEFCFHYQPKFDLRSGALAGFESLVRWQHPGRGLLPPGAFLHQVASTGFKAELARTALRDAVGRLEEWHEGGSTTHLSINVELDDATDPSFLLQLTGAVNAMSAPPSSLIIELLETKADLDLCAAAAVLTRVRLLGVGLSIDDFGTQSSSLARLQHLPANELKIDRSFIANLLKFKQDQIIVRSVIGMARELGLTSVAEGIEDRETMTMLLQMGCAFGQGFYMAKPMAHVDATELLKQGTPRAGAKRFG